MMGLAAQTALTVALCVSSVGQTIQINTTSSRTGETPQHPSATDIYEAVLRYQIKSWELAADSYCVEVNGTDADKALLERFTPLNVKVASECRKQTSQLVMMRIVDKKTGKRSVIFDMGEIHWLEGSEAEVDGGYLCGSQCTAEGIYRVAWDGSRWSVMKFDIRVQS
jgi:hypothetical protein